MVKIEIRSPNLQIVQAEKIVDKIYRDHISQMWINKVPHGCNVFLVLTKYIRVPKAIKTSADGEPPFITISPWWWKREEVADSDLYRSRHYRIEATMEQLKMEARKLQQELKLLKERLNDQMQLGVKTALGLEKRKELKDVIEGIDQVIAQDPGDLERWTRSTNCRNNQDFHDTDCSDSLPKKRSRDIPQPLT